MTKSVFGLADNDSHAQRIVTILQSSGFNNDAISVLFSDRKGVYQTTISPTGTRTTTTPTGKSYSTTGNGFTTRESTNVEKSQKKGSFGHEKGTKAPEGATTGAVAGGAIGGSLGLLAGIGALAIPGLGPFIAAGPLMAALAGSAVGGSLGLLVGALVGLGIPEYVAKKYEDNLKEGKVLIVVHTNNSEEIDQATEILKNEGARDISTATESKKSSRKNY